MLTTEAQTPAKCGGWAAGRSTSERADSFDGFDGFDGFVEAHGERLLGLARRSLRDPWAAEEVLQDVLARVYFRWDRIRVLGDPIAYVDGMVVDACTSWWRRAARRETTVDRQTDAGEAAQATAVVARDHMLALLRRLPGKQRVVLALRHYERMDDAEIARLLGVSTGTVRSNASGGLARLRQHLGCIRAGPDLSWVPAPRTNTDRPGCGGNSCGGHDSGLRPVAWRELS